LKMTVSGNLSRVVVTKMCDLFTWPEFDKVALFQFNRVINEPDFLPLYFVRHVAQLGMLLRKHQGHLKISPAGRRMLEEPNLRALQAMLFRIAFWHFDLGNRSRGLHPGWPQRDAGLVLWCLSVAAGLATARAPFAIVHSPHQRCARPDMGYGFLCYGGTDPTTTAVVWAPRASARRRRCESLRVVPFLSQDRIV
jgi:hypothetical protein